MRRHKTKASLQGDIRNRRSRRTKTLLSAGLCEDSFPMLRKLAWVLTFILATFCWVVVIEHGPDNFIIGSKIEAENFKSLFFRLIQAPGK
jgi:hypothetical protein